MDSNVDSRLSRLETIIDSISKSIEQISERLDSQTKINWAPIAIGVTIFFTVCGSVATIYNTRISTLNTAVESIAKNVGELEKSEIEKQLKIQSSDEKIQRLEIDVEKLSDKVANLEKQAN